MVTGIARWPADPRTRRRLERAFAAGEAVGHEATLIGDGHSDQMVCSCGWESTAYWDGMPYAHEQWLEHIRAKGAVLDVEERAPP